MPKHLTIEDLKSIATIVDQAIDPLRQDAEELKSGVSSLTTSVDNLAHTVDRHEMEWQVLRKQHDRMHVALVNKGVATEDDLAIA